MTVILKFFSKSEKSHNGEKHGTFLSKTEKEDNTVTDYLKC